MSAGVETDLINLNGQFVVAWGAKSVDLSTQRVRLSSNRHYIRSTQAAKGRCV